MPWPDSPCLQTSRMFRSGHTSLFCAKQGGGQRAPAWPGPPRSRPSLLTMYHCLENQGSVGTARERFTRRRRVCCSNHRTWGGMRAEGGAAPPGPARTPPNSPHHYLPGGPSWCGTGSGTPCLLGPHVPGDLPMHAPQWPFSVLPPAEGRTRPAYPPPPCPPAASPAPCQLSAEILPWLPTTLSRAHGALPVCPSPAPLCCGRSGHLAWAFAHALPARGCSSSFLVDLPPVPTNQLMSPTPVSAVGASVSPLALLPS